MSGGTDVGASTPFEQAMGLAVKRMTGATIGKVGAYDPATERATVTSLVPILVDDEGTVDPVVTIYDVPVEWPQTHNAAGALVHSVKFPLPVGSFVSLEPKGHDHSQWFTTGKSVPPKDSRRFSIADIVARPWSPVPLSTAPVDTESYDAVFAVLGGAWCVGGNAASTKAVTLQGDPVDKHSVPPAAGFAEWCQAMETAVNGLIAPGVIAPPISGITQIGNARASATKLKAK